MAKTKKVKSAGRFGVKAGTNVRNRLVAIENLQRKKQTCPFCSRKNAKRTSAGVWHCQKCGKKFAGHAYYLSRS